MCRWNIFLIECLLTSPQIKMAKRPIKSHTSDRSSFLHQHSVKFQFVWHKLFYNIPLARLLQKHVGLCDSSAKYQKSVVCLHKIYLVVVLWNSTFYRNDGLSMTCQCQQLKLNLLSTQINIHCLMANYMPALLVQRAPWTQAAVMLLKSLYFPRPPPRTAIFPDARPPQYNTKSRWLP